MENQIPRPVLDGDSKPFWEAVQRKELLIKQCGDCHQHIFYPRSICPHCFSDNVKWVSSSGRGRIYSYTVVHRAYGPFRGQTPFVVALVDLEEGVRMMTRIQGDREKVAIDLPVRVTFEQVDEELTLPYFELV
ncbi:Zn-ribbon domain-containing OB-fold protein [Alicyclobacillus tolerans]|uniref:Zn-ribbon domain-containing OB-fold protein n=1 Tax=Alicyclobacillus tolerans TaxID=90970 RepID=UPI001F2D2AE2|nr:Zn-ribbon domain-containing OB-fold protein [Alicyclobacillus tolerans]MCF8564346.1 Zn-ribbon domain-containing OB-fold protein [Alicyclobacillus tolerans]